ncbi:hypothetical protein D3C71_1819790 [compost metagenome]
MKVPADLIWSNPDWAWAAPRAVAWIRPAMNNERKSFMAMLRKIGVILEGTVMHRSPVIAAL